MSHFKMELHDKDEYISRHIQKHNCWEPITTEVLIELFKNISSPTTFVDIGANIGYFSFIAALYKVPTAAFEPIAANYALITSTIDKNNLHDLIHPRMVALSNKHEKITLNVSHGNMGLCSTRKLSDTDHSYSQSSMAEPLDRYFGSKTKNNLIVKIDVEEQELKVLQGMELTLASGKITHIILEISRYNEELFNLLYRYGYNYCIDIGYEGPEKTTVNKDTNYLRTSVYFDTLRAVGIKMQTHTRKIKQKMLLIYNMPNPI